MACVLVLPCPFRASWSSHAAPPLRGWQSVSIADQGLTLRVSSRPKPPTRLHNTAAHTQQQAASHGSSPAGSDGASAAQRASLPCWVASSMPRARPRGRPCARARRRVTTPDSAKKSVGRKPPATACQSSRAAPVERFGPHREPACCKGGEQH